MKRFAFVRVAGLVCGLVWAGLSTANAQPAAAPSETAKRPIAFADLMAMKRVSDPQISPSGKWVLFSVTGVSLEKNTKVNHLWVVPLDGSAPERQVTFADGESFGRFSPDGRWLSYTAKDQIDRAPWDEAAGKPGEPRALTHVPGGADGAIWSPDSRRLLFTAEVYPECSVATEMELAWTEEDACDQARDDAAAASPVKAQLWDALLYRHWDHYTGQQRSHILVMDADGAHVRDLTPSSAVGDAETPTWFLGGPQEYAWAPDSQEIAYVVNLDKVPAASTNNDVFTLRLDAPAAKAVKVSTSPGSDDEPEYSPDGKYLAFRSQARAGFESDKFRLMVMERVSGSAGQQVGGREWSAPKDLMPKFDRWVDEFTWAPDSSAFYFASGNIGEESMYSVSVDGSDLVKVHDPYLRGELGELHLSPDGKTLVASRMSLDSPSSIYSFETKEDPGWFKDPVTWKGLDMWLSGISSVESRIVKSRQLTHLNDSMLASLYLDGLESFIFQGAGGDPVEGFLLKPPNFDPNKKYPLKFLMHGGPQTAWGDAWSYRWNWELMAASGYVVIGINRRGSTGYGQKFVDEVSGDWGGRAFTDLMKGLDYAEATFPFIDKTRECALGASYGGYMADWVLTHTTRFQCIVTHDGMFDPASAYGSTEELWFNEWEFRTPADYPKGWDGFPPNPRQTAAGHPAQPWRYQDLPADQDPFRKWSPARFIQNAKTPTLIIHSQRDYRLDVSQGFELFTALQRLGVPSQMLYFPDEGHWVLKPQNSELWYQTVADWCDRWTHSNAYAETK